MKNYMIIGATSGIGEACAKKLADDNNVLIVVGRNQKKLSDLQKSLKGHILPITYDLENIYDIKKIYEICFQKKIKLDGLIYSAGIDGTWPVKINPIDKMRQMMDVNCFAFVELAKHFYSKRNSNDGASIVAISSISSLTMEPGMMAYSASKAALNSVVKTMAKEFIRRKIRVNAVLPSGVMTGMTEEKGELIETVQGVVQSLKHENVQSLGMISPEQVAEEVAFLLSDKTLYKTGELEVISGGKWY